MVRRAFRALLRPAAGESGGVLIEAALVVPVVLLVACFGVVMAGRIVHAQVAVASRGARGGAHARPGAVRGRTGSPAPARARWPWRTVTGFRRQMLFSLCSRQVPFRRGGTVRAIASYRVALGDLPLLGRMGVTVREFARGARRALPQQGGGATVSGSRRRFHEDERGAAMVLVALWLVALVSVAGLVVDGGMLLAQRRALQNVADAAAAAGAMQLDESPLPLIRRVGGRTRSRPRRMRRPKATWRRRTGLAYTVTAGRGAGCGRGRAPGPDGLPARDRHRPREHPRPRLGRTAARGRAGGGWWGAGRGGGVVTGEGRIAVRASSRGRGRGARGRAARLGRWWRRAERGGARRGRAGGSGAAGARGAARRPPSPTRRAHAGAGAGSLRRGEGRGRLPRVLGRLRPGRPAGSTPRSWRASPRARSCGGSARRSRS